MKGPFEVSLLIENHPCEIMKLISLFNIKANVENVKLRESVTDHIVNLEGKMDEEEFFKLKNSSLKVLRLSDNKLWIRTNGCSVCKLLYSSDVIVEKVKVVREKTLLYTLLVPNNSSLKDFLNRLANEGVKVTVLNINEINEDQLTERQMEILQLAYKLGYFDDDRKITLSELAEKLGISVPTLDEILRRALKKVVKYYINKK
ncbi:helix-turn-helix domain-containing protein [Sulfurisphaera javensis]|uniref:Helix-turn-helix domain-containing protein n=1 Tax=Sulfurisphaera javensis TaxID=2049879 RepID=A0AAT9GS37_9CREN